MLIFAPRSLQRLPVQSIICSRLHYLVGPADPISNLRKVRYEGTPTVPPPSVLAEAHKFNLRHPYSLSEFKGDISDEEFDLHRRVQMQQMDTLDQQFWTDSNQRFEAAKRATLWALPLGASSIDKEKALSDFYTGWVAQERLRQHEYTKQHRSAVLTELAIAARYEYRRVKGLFGRSA